MAATAATLALQCGRRGQRQPSAAKTLAESPFPFAETCSVASARSFLLQPTHLARGGGTSWRLLGNRRNRRASRIVDGNLRLPLCSLFSSSFFRRTELPLLCSHAQLFVSTESSWGPYSSGRRSPTLAGWRSTNGGCDSGAALSVSRALPCSHPEGAPELLPSFALEASPEAPSELSLFLV